MSAKTWILHVSDESGRKSSINVSADYDDFYHCAVLREGSQFLREETPLPLGNVSIRALGILMHVAKHGHVKKSFYMAHPTGPDPELVDHTETLWVEIFGEALVSGSAALAPWRNATFVCICMQCS